MRIYEGYFNDNKINNDDIVTDIEQSNINNIKQYSTLLRLEVCFPNDTYLFNNPDVDKPSASLEEVARTVCRYFYKKITTFLDMYLYINDYAEPIFQVQTERNEGFNPYSISPNTFKFDDYFWEDKSLKKDAMFNLIKICQYMVPSLTEKDIKKAKRELMKK